MLEAFRRHMDAIDALAAAQATFFATGGRNGADLRLAWENYYLTAAQFGSEANGPA